MRTIVLLLIAALVLTPTLAHAMNDGGFYGAIGIALFPVLVILLLAKLSEQHPRATEAPVLPAPAIGSDR